MSYKRYGTVLRYTEEERNRALEVSLTSLAASMGYTPIRQGNNFILQEMDSLVIYNDCSWNRWSGKGNIKGGTQIDFLLEFGNVATVPEAVHHNIVHCGRNPEGEVRYAGLRGTADIYGKKFKMDVPGNDKNYGVNIVNPEMDEVKVFESVIDCMSYIDMTGDRTSNKLVLGMVADNPLEQFLKDYSHIKKLSFCLDNDPAGRQLSV